MLKATLVVGIALSLNFSGNLLTAVILAVLLGHMYPIFYNFKGGKGVATALGILLAINWELALFTLLTWIIIFFISKYSSLSAIIAAIASPLIAYFLNQDQHIIIISVVLAILILFRHKRNIQNLINGTESSFKSN